MSEHYLFTICCWTVFQERLRGKKTIYNLEKQFESLRNKARPSVKLYFWVFDLSNQEISLFNYFKHFCWSFYAWKTMSSISLLIPQEPARALPIFLNALPSKSFPNDFQLSLVTFCFACIGDFFSPVVIIVNDYF